jgi:hypothetical protein
LIIFSTVAGRVILAFSGMSPQILFWLNFQAEGMLHFNREKIHNDGRDGRVYDTRTIFMHRSIVHLEVRLMKELPLNIWSAELFYADGRDASGQPNVAEASPAAKRGKLRRVRKSI